MANSSVLGSRPWAAGAAVIGLVMVAVYVALVVAQGDAGFFEILPWALLMFIAAVLALAAARTSDARIARNLLIGAALVYGVLGVVSLLTIGVMFIVAAAVSAVGAARLSGPSVS